MGGRIGWRPLDERVVGSLDVGGAIRFVDGFVGGCVGWLLRDGLVEGWVAR